MHEDIFACQIALFGVEGQQRLRESSILVVGLGGLGAACLPYLAGSGIGQITLLDFDRVEPSNLPRQTLYSETDIGSWKAESALKRLQTQYPKTQFTHQIQRVEQANLTPFDLILDATDNSSARYTINDLCRALKKPWIYGSIQHPEGQVAFFSPNNPDYRTLFPDAANSPLPPCSSGGILGPLAGIIGSIQALEAIKYLATGISDLEGKLLCFDTKRWRTQLFRLTQENGSIRADELKALLEKENVYLIDATNPIAAELLPKDRKIVFHCPLGIRSQTLAMRLRKEGFHTYYLID